MKSVLIFVALIVACNAVTNSYTQGHNGRPACRTAEEMLRPYRNNFDPTKYWVCYQQNTPAAPLDCPSFSGFMDTAPVFGCVDWDKYIYQQPYDPPSMAPASAP